MRITVTGADLRKRNLEQIKVSPRPVILNHTGLYEFYTTLPVAQPE